MKAFITRLRNHSFVLDWKQFGPKIALDNQLIGFTKWFVRAKRIQLTFKKRGEK